MISISYTFAQKFLRSSKCQNFVPRVAFHLCSKLVNRYTTEERYKETGNTVFEDYEPGVGRIDEQTKIPTKKEIKNSLKIAEEEFEKWIEEQKENLKFDPLLVFEPSKVYKVFSFGRKEDPKTWSTLTDQDEGYGYSTCEFTTSRNGCAVFKGNLSTEIVPDGMTYRSGFAAIRAPRPMKSFVRKDCYDWGMFTHLVIRLRGDGRTYMLLLGAEGQLDVTWYQAHSYALFTRGGPYWQVSKIPFSKFFLTHKGYIQDKQWAPFACSISTFGISLMDDVDGPFHLEIDYIGLETDLLHDEEHAYETYKHENVLGDC